MSQAFHGSNDEASDVRMMWRAAGAHPGSAWLADICAKPDTPDKLSPAAINGDMK
jgi:hypothetical protein